ncbi:MAG: hypothetical protein ACLFR8_03315 [Alkalispirochaeta sp.]
MKRFVLILVIVGVVPVVAAEEARPVSVAVAAELGFVDIPYHRIKIGESTDTFDYVGEGGQELLFPYSRFWADITLGTAQRHHLRLLYQPLTFETVTQFEETRVIDTETFEAGQVVDVYYGFDFWRGTYRYRFIDTPSWELDGGLSMQIRNASIRFIAQNTDEAVITQDNGPVPILSMRVRRTFAGAPWVELDADGFYASNSFFNGADYPFTGFIWDAALSVGAPLRDRTEAFVTARAIGGGARGTSQDDRDTWTQSLAGGSERYNDNVISTVAIALGLRLEL